VFLVACSGGGSEADSGGDDGTVPEAPVVGPGEVAVDVEIEGEAFRVACDPSQGAQASLSIDVAGALDVFIFSCSPSSLQHPLSALSLVVRDDAIGVGSTELVGGSDGGHDEAGGTTTDADGNGWSLDLTNYIGEGLSGSLQLDEVGGSGGAIRGSFVCEWEETGVVESGAGVAYDAVAGRAVGAFDLVLP